MPVPRRHISQTERLKSGSEIDEAIDNSGSGGSRFTPAEIGSGGSGHQSVDTDYGHRDQYCAYADDDRGREEEDRHKDRQHKHTCVADSSRGAAAGMKMMVGNIAGEKAADDAAETQ